MRAAVTGGTGFLGAALVKRLLSEDWGVTALARDPRRLKNIGAVRVVEGDLQNEVALRDLAAGADIFFHLAGVTHAYDDDYHAVNVIGAGNAARASAHAGAKLIHVSSLSARMPDTSPYARSKFESETVVERETGAAPWLALRLPALYGPGDLVTLPYFKLVKSGLALEPRTTTPARASILFVDDAASALITAAQEASVGVVYEVGDEVPAGREWREIGQILGDTLGRVPHRIRVPQPFIRAYHGVLRAAERSLGKSPSVRAGQVNEFFHPDWVARDNLLSEISGWQATTPLKEGFAKTVHWYQEHGLL